MLFVQLTDEDGSKIALNVLMVVSVTLVGGKTQVRYNFSFAGGGATFFTQESYDVVVRRIKECTP